MSIEPIAMTELKKWLPPTLEITSKVHKLQAKIIPDCLFKCIFSIILKLSLHFKIISMPIYSEPQVKAPDHNAFAANTVINFLRLMEQELIFSAPKNENMCKWRNGTAWLEHCDRYFRFPIRTILATVDLQATLILQI